MSARPSVKDVQNWRVEFESAKVTVESGDASFGGYMMSGGVWKVVPAGGRPKYFFGESAWMNARRVAADIDFGAWSI